MTEPVVEVHQISKDADRSLHRDARQGLTSSPKWLAPKWFYDARGSDLFEEITRLPEYYPTLAIHWVVADLTQHLDRIPGQSPRLVAFLGGTIGNFLPDERAVVLGDLHDTLVPGDWLPPGTDLVKDPGVLVPAYDDAAGVTADFNRNVLAVLNRELGADFDLGSYQYVALWDPENEWIEMRLRAANPARVTLSKLDLDITVQAGEEIRTEISAKFRKDGVGDELAKAGFEMDSWWTDPEGRFALSLARAR